MSQPVWDPALYERYKIYRDRPALDLLLQIPGELRPREIWDLGCGTGEHAALLAARHSGAKVHGLDASPDMLAAARRRGAAVEWLQGDVRDWAPAIAPDLVFSNAALQWLPDHESLFPAIMAHVAPGGVFACQVPISYHEPWYVDLRAVVEDGPWANRLAGVKGVYPTAAPSDYYRWLSPLCSEVDIWSTTYLHVLEGDDPIVEWMSGTGLRPYLQALQSGEERTAFLATYRERSVTTFPRQADGTTLFPFPRLFIRATRGPR